jgi:uracil phosphoribosyltransferase
MAFTPDSQFDHLRFKLSETEHRYGPNVHLLSDPFLLSHLARLCSEDTDQPIINELVTTLYSSLLKIVVNQEFPQVKKQFRTRMIAHHAEGIFEGPVVDPTTPVVSVNLARAGTLPSHLCYTALNYFMNPKTVRQDHISIARATNSDHQVVGSQVSGHKIGGPVAGAIVLFPDPMGATGGTIVEAIDLYKKTEKNNGKPHKVIALHCIVTPEYLKRVTHAHPELLIYAIRLDRGLSKPEILKTVPGTHWEQEKGLNASQYIVPGGGGFGEIMNNAYA